jgi:NADH-quinone oxidoreductase subunit G
MNAAEMAQSVVSGYVLLGVEPEADCAYARETLKALRAAQFVVTMSAFRSPVMDQIAHVQLPIAPFTETSGTFVNAEGRWQSFAGAIAPLSDARPAWKVLRVLGNLLRLPGYDYLSSEEVRDELLERVGNARADNKVPWRAPASLKPKTDGIIRIIETPIYAVDALVRRAVALQETAGAPASAVYVSEEFANTLGLREGQSVALSQGADELALPVRFDARVPHQCVLVYAGQPGAELLGPTGPVTVRGI